MRLPDPHRKWSLLLGVLLATSIMFVPSVAKTPSPPKRVLDDSPPAFRDQFVERHSPPYPISKTPGLYSAADWASAIDSVWGPGLSWSDHLNIWSTYWTKVDQYFACFSGLDSSVWQDVWDLYYPEIQDTVSRGRLCAITEWSTLPLHEAHTVVGDTVVLYDSLLPGVPLFWIGGWGNADHFGAALTALPDSSLLVCRAVNPHPLGLVPGDIVLGYDGVPWKNLYPQIIQAELPVFGEWIGSNEKAMTESFLTGAGMNWHLFDTIDVLKYATKDTVHLPTSLLVGQEMTMWASEQLDEPGVARPDPSLGETTTWGVITGTHVGYLYTIGWFPHADSAKIVNEWLNALDSMRNVYHVSGVILDFRLNFGEAFSTSRILDYFFDSTWKVMELEKRCGPGHFDLCPDLSSPLFHSIDSIPGDIDAHWDRPLAILTGPGALSGGDINPMIVSRHPMAKVFGKPSAGAFSGVSNYSLYPGWILRITDHTIYLTDDPGDYLVRKEFPSVADFPWVDYQPVWLTPDGVANGRDDVVDSAVAWIQSRDVDGDGVVNESDNCPDAYNPAQEDADSNGVGDSCECNVVVVDVTGDVNLSGSITSADIIGLVNYVFKSGAEPQPCVGAGDVNCSGTVTSADIIGLVNFVFKSGTPPCDVCTLIPATWTCP
jgi:hypothetical protein